MRIGRREVKLTNLEKIYFPKVGLTKGDLVQYYVDVAPHALRAVSRRPMQMKRYPEGVDGFFFFYQKRVPQPHLRERIDAVGDLTAGMWRRKVSLLPKFERLGLEAPTP